MVSKKQASPEAYERQLSTLTQWQIKEKGRPTNNSPIKVFEDQTAILDKMAKEKKVTRSEIVRELLDTVLFSDRNETA